MSADACIVYFGLRFETADHEMEALESRTDPRIVAARDARLRHFWENFFVDGDRYLLFVGAQIAILGPENGLETQLTRAELETIMQETKVKLRAAGFQGEPKLYVQWYPDY
ncbi:MAG: hypothetical protein DWQ37_14840 [Planctomycetota bacterium]|nr:MAG: hypothetical protein DWQ37_14840 [Planctomycetota bacterium]